MFKKIGKLGIILVAVIAVVLFLREVFEPAYQSELESGYADLIAGMEDAESNLTSLIAMAPPRNERHLTDGYRYLMGHMVRIANSEINNNPYVPHFERAVTFLSKWTGDNADNLYLVAPIDGNAQYRVSGKIPYSSQQNAKTLSDVTEAPGLVLVQTITNLIGDTGSLKEIPECRNQTLDGLNSYEIQTAADGSFEILLSPDRPEGYTGNWIDTLTEVGCTDSDGKETVEVKKALNIVIRETFIDWDEEQLIDLDIVRLDYEGMPPPVVSAKERAQQLATIGEKVPNQIFFWNWIMGFGLEAYGDYNFDGELRQPTNDVNPPAPPFIAGGTAGSNLFYAAGLYDLKLDEALIFGIFMPRTPEYMGFHLQNFWMESFDQANYLTSRNISQVEFFDEQHTYLVLSHSDPGVQNWIDTMAVEKAAQVFRFWYSSDVQNGQLPIISAKVVKLNSVFTELPDAKQVNSDFRRKEIAVRQRHIRQRFREF